MIGILESHLTIKRMYHNQIYISLCHDHVHIRFSSEYINSYDAFYTHHKQPYIYKTYMFLSRLQYTIVYVCIEECNCSQEI